MKYWYSLIFSSVALFSLPAQPCQYLSGDVASYLRHTISYLASDSLQGRYPGSPGDALAQEYIVAAFRQMELSPTFEGHYRQAFQFPDGVSQETPASLQVAGEPQEAFFPVAYSANGQVEAPTAFVQYGIEAPELQRQDLRGINLQDRIAVMDISSPDGIHPHSQYGAYHSVAERLKVLQERGALATLLVNLHQNANDPRQDFSKVQSVGMPVVFITDTSLARRLTRPQQVTLSVALRQKEVETHNLSAYLDNGAEQTVIVGAHYDHLGLGGSNSLYQGEPVVHNGADDNASGTAGLLALARYLSATKKAEFKKFNYLFIAFAAEEKGLLGSNYFVEQVNLSPFNPAYMLNMDMIGRLEENTLAVNGVGTSPAWPDLLAEASCSLRVKTSEAGTGPSDHTSFYYQEMPVLHFFTGTHHDYHKPTDDADKINYEGEVQVLNYMLTLLALSGKEDSIPFSPAEAEQRQAARFTVTLGVMPDYMYEDGGLKIDGVSPGKPAATAGIQAGDVVVQMGQTPIEDIYQYMEALSGYQKGDRTSVKLRRGEEILIVEVTF